MNCDGPWREKKGNLKANPNGPIDDGTSPWAKTAAVATPLQRALDRIEGTILNFHCYLNGSARCKRLRKIIGSIMLTFIILIIVTNFTLNVTV